MVFREFSCDAESASSVLPFSCCCIPVVVPGFVPPAASAGEPRLMGNRPVSGSGFVALPASSGSDDDLEPGVGCGDALSDELERLPMLRTAAADTCCVTECSSTPSHAAVLSDVASTDASFEWLRDVSLCCWMLLTEFRVPPERILTKCERLVALAMMGLLLVCVTLLVVGCDKTRQVFGDDINFGSNSFGVLGVVEVLGACFFLVAGPWNFLFLRQLSAYVMSLCHCLVGIGLLVVCIANANYPLYVRLENCALLFLELVVGASFFVAMFRLDPAEAPFIGCPSDHCSNDVVVVGVVVDALLPDDDVASTSFFHINCAVASSK